MQSFDGDDFMASPISVVSTEDEKSVSGDWVDKVMVKSHLGEDGSQSPEIYHKSRRDTSSKVYPEQSLSRIATLRRENSSGRIQCEAAAATDELEDIVIEASDESDYQSQTNGAKQNGGGGTKAKKPTQNQRQLKSPEIRYHLPCLENMTLKFMIQQRKFILEVFHTYSFYVCNLCVINRSLIPQPPTRKVANGSNSPSHKKGKKPAPVDGKRKPASTGGK